MPSLIIDSGGRVLGVLEVPREDIGPFDANLALPCYSVILHLRDVDQFDATTSDWGADVLGDVVSLHGQRDGRGTFCLPVAFHHLKIGNTPDLSTPT